MSFAQKVLGGDLARMARDGVDTSFDPRARNPAAVSEADFIEKNGMTRAEYRARNAVWARENAEADILRDLNGELPALADMRGLSPARAAYANYFALRQSERKKLSDLEAKKAELEAMIASPCGVETEVRNGIKRTAARLLGRATDSGEAEAATLAGKLAIAHHKAEAAKLALPELERDIDRQQLRVKRLNERESEFLNAAIIEIADASGLGQLYMKAIAEARAIGALLFELRDVAGGYGSGFSFSREAINFPRPGLPSLKGTPDSEFQVRPDSTSHVFKNIAQALRLDPKHKAHIPLPTK